MIDEEVHDIVETQYIRAKQLLSANKKSLENLAKRLLEKEVIYSNDLEEIFGKRKYKDNFEVPELDSNMQSKEKTDKKSILEVGD